MYGKQLSSTPRGECLISVARRRITYFSQIASLTVLGRAHHLFLSSARPIQKLYLLWDRFGTWGICRRYDSFCCARFNRGGRFARANRRRGSSFAGRVVWIIGRLRGMVFLRIGSGPGACAPGQNAMTCRPPVAYNVWRTVIRGRLLNLDRMSDLERAPRRLWGGDVSAVKMGRYGPSERRRRADDSLAWLILAIPLLRRDQSHRSEVQGCMLFVA